MVNPKITKYAVNGSGGAYVSIPATTWCRYVEIIEDDAATAQGLTIQLPADNFGSTDSISAAHEPFKLGEPAYQGSTGNLLGYTATSDARGNSYPATTLCKVRSLTATATTVQVKEWQ